MRTFLQQNASNVQSNIYHYKITWVAFIHNFAPLKNSLSEISPPDTSDTNDIAP